MQTVYVLELPIVPVVLRLPVDSLGVSMLHILLLTGKISAAPSTLMVTAVGLPA
jgi:hypothetical protein